VTTRIRPARDLRISNRSIKGMIPALPSGEVRIPILDLDDAGGFFMIAIL
jgi:hypothetical protein